MAGRPLDSKPIRLDHGENEDSEDHPSYDDAMVPSMASSPGGSGQSRRIDRQPGEVCTPRYGTVNLGILIFAVNQAGSVSSRAGDQHQTGRRRRSFR